MPHTGIDACHQPLRSSLFVAGASVELAGAEKSGKGLVLQTQRKLLGVDAVVFDGIGAAHQTYIFQSLDGPVEGLLHVFGKTGGQALQVHFIGI